MEAQAAAAAEGTIASSIAQHFVESSLIADPGAKSSTAQARYTPLFPSTSTASQHPQALQQPHHAADMP